MRARLPFLTWFVALALACGCAAAEELTPQERAWLRDNPGKLVLVFDPRYAPIEFGESTHTGIAADIVDKIEARLGVKFIRRPEPDWTEALRKLGSGEAAVIAVLSPNPERERYALFTKPYLVLPMVVIGQKGGGRWVTLEGLQGRRVAVVKNYLTDLILSEKAPRSASLVRVPTVEDGLRMVAFGDADCFVDSLAVCSHYLEKNPLANLSVCGELPYQYSYSISVSRKYPLLYSAVAKAVEGLSPAEIRDIRGRWIQLRYYDFRKVRILFWAFGLLTAALLATSAALWRRRVVERRRAREAEARHLEELEELAGRIPGGVFFRVALDGAGQRRFKYISGGIRAMFGLEPSQVLESFQVFMDRVNPSDLEALIVKEKAAALGIHPFRAELRIRDAAGAERWHLLTVAPQKGAAGEVMFNGAIIDINEQKRLGRELKTSEQKYRQIIENAPLGIYRCGSDGRFELANGWMARQFGFGSTAEFLESHPTLGGCWLDPAARGLFVEALRSHGRVAGMEMRHAVRGSVAEGWMLVYAFRDGDSPEVYGFVADITELKAAHADLMGEMEKRRKAFEEKELLLRKLHQGQKLEALGQLAGGVAHDFNNVLAGIMGAAEMLKMKGLSEEERDGYETMIITAAERAGELTRKLLAFSRTPMLPQTVVDVQEVLRDTAMILRRTLDKKTDIVLENRAAPRPFVVGDASLLQSAFINLGINAGQAMPEGGRLEFVLEDEFVGGDACVRPPFTLKPGRHLRVRVRDTGCGMPEDVLAHAFEPFFTTKPKGNGLGLAAVYGTVKEHEGAIKVESAVGAGTVVEILLPATTQEPQPPSPGPAAALQGGATVLVADDEPHIRKTARKMLEAWGYGVVEAANGAEAVAALKAGPKGIDAVLLDVIMPVMGGREALRELRAIEPGIPIAIMSGFIDEADADALKREKVEAYLSKPFHQDELAMVVRGLFAARGAKTP